MIVCTLSYSLYTTKIATYVEHMLDVCLTYVHEHMLNIKNEQHMFNICFETYIYYKYIFKNSVKHIKTYVLRMSTTCSTYV